MQTIKESKNQICDFQLYVDLGNTEGDIGTETVWRGNEIVDNKKIKLNYNDKG